MKTYKQLPIPEDSAWDRNNRTFNPYTLFDGWIYNNFKYSWFHNQWDRFIDIPIGNFKEGIKNLWKWLPIIWKQRDWDSSYIFEIIKHKLLLQREEIVGANRHTTVWQTNRDITICLNLIERLQESYYENEYQDYHEQTFEFIPSGNKYEGEDTFKMESTTIRKDFVPYFAKYINAYKYLRKNGRFGRKLRREDDDAIALYIGEYNHEKAKKLLFRILNDRIETFWD